MSDPDAFTQKASGATSAKEGVLSKEETIEVEASHSKGAEEDVRSTPHAAKKRSGRRSM
jgi:hypothetical protein